MASKSKHTSLKQLKKQHSSQSNEPNPMNPSLLNPQRVSKIKQATLQKPYLYTFIVISLTYITANIVLNQLYITAPYSFSNPAFAIPFTVFNLTIAGLVALNINLLVIKFKELRSIHHGSTFALLGTFAGVMGGACPGCFVGVFPAVLGIFGITASLSSLPFLGLEVLALSIILLAISTVLLTKENVCKVKI